MTKIALRNEQDVEDFVRGCAFFGTGGGGDPKLGCQLLGETVREGKQIEFVDVDDLADNSWITMPAGMGSIAPVTEEKREMLKGLGLKEEKIKRTLVAAVERLEEYLDREIKAIIAAELGGFNTPAPVDVAGRLGKVVIDGDYAGRAIPEVEQCLPAIKGKGITPIVCVDNFGNTTIIEKVTTLAAAEKLGKLVSTLATGLCGETFFTSTAKDLREAIIPGTLSESYQIGRAIREARESNKDPVKAVMEYGNGWLLFEGTVREKDWEDKQGYMWGSVKIKGAGQFEGHDFKIWFKNENHITWLNDESYVTSPDIIEVVQREDAEPITNTDISQGDKVAVIGMRARKQHREGKALEMIEPRHYGYDIDYRPIEDIM